MIKTIKLAEIKAQCEEGNFSDDDIDGFQERLNQLITEFNKGIVYTKIVLTEGTL